MASSMAWQMEGEKLEIVTDFLVLGSKIIADGDCSREIRRWLLLGRKAMTKLDSVLKCRGITLPAKAHIVRAMVFPVVTYGCESWTIKKGECQRIEGFELWCWRRLLKVRWRARRSSQSILREINPGHSLGGLMLKLKRQDSGHLMWTDNSLEKSLMLGKDRGQKEKRASEDETAERHHQFNKDELGQTLGDGEGQGGLAWCSPWGRRVGHDWATEQQEEFLSWWGDHEI